MDIRRGDVITVERLGTPNVNVSTVPFRIIVQSIRPATVEGAYIIHGDRLTWDVPPHIRRSKFLIFAREITKVERKKNSN